MGLSADFPRIFLSPEYFRHKTRFIGRYKTTNIILDVMRIVVVVSATGNNTTSPNQVASVLLRRLISNPRLMLCLCEKVLVVRHVDPTCARSIPWSNMCATQGDETVEIGAECIIGNQMSSRNPFRQDILVIRPADDDLNRVCFSSERKWKLKF